VKIKARVIRRARVKGVCLVCSMRRFDVHQSTNKVVSENKIRIYLHVELYCISRPCSGRCPGSTHTARKPFATRGPTQSCRATLQLKVARVPLATAYVFAYMHVLGVCWRVHIPGGLQKPKIDTTDRIAVSHRRAGRQNEFAARGHLVCALLQSVHPFTDLVRNHFDAAILAG